MFIRQLIDYDTFTYTYLIADPAKGVAALIDPVLKHVPQYLTLLQELNFTLTAAIDTHIHADHITALGTLREKTGSNTYIGLDNEVTCSSHALHHNDTVPIGSIQLQVLHTPGHTDNSFCFFTQAEEARYLFTGDTLLIRGTGRTDFQNGDPAALYNSLHNILFRLPEDTVVYPGHDYNGVTQSTIKEEKQHNPRAKILERNAFIQHMNNLYLPPPKWMDIAVPANLICGKKSTGDSNAG